MELESTRHKHRMPLLSLHTDDITQKLFTGMGSEFHKAQVPAQVFVYIYVMFMGSE